MSNLQTKRTRGIVAVSDLQASIRFDNSVIKLLRIIYFQFAKVKRMIKRRRLESNPNIICGFPIQQKAREEAPFF